MTAKDIPVVVFVVASTCQMCLARRQGGICLHCDRAPNCPPSCQRCRNASVYDGVGPRR